MKKIEDECYDESHLDLPLPVCLRVRLKGVCSGTASTDGEKAYFLSSHHTYYCHSTPILTPAYTLHTSSKMRPLTREQKADLLKQLRSTLKAAAHKFAKSPEGTTWADYRILSPSTCAYRRPYVNQFSAVNPFSFPHQALRLSPPCTCAYSRLSSSMALRYGHIQSYALRVLLTRQRRA